MPIKDEITCGDGCFCVGENTSIIKEEWSRNNSHNKSKIYEALHRTELFTDNITSISTSCTGRQTMLKKEEADTIKQMQQGQKGFLKNGACM